MSKVNLEDIVKEFNTEIIELEKINKICESVSDKLKKLYRQKFPKVCNCCKRVYRTRREYLKETKTLRDGSTIYSKRLSPNKQIQEYRNCVCGSTLLIMTSDRRDNSKLGELRRELFNICLKKLMVLTKDDRDTVKFKLRKVFRKTMNELKKAG